MVDGADASGPRRFVRLDRLLSLVALGLLVAGCALVLRPFLSAMLWATILAYTTWPFQEWLVARVNGRRVTAAACVVFVFVLALIVPLTVVTVNLAASIAEAVAWVRAVADNPTQPPPDWLADIPGIGGWLAETWAVAARDMDVWVDRLRDLLAAKSGWLVQRGIDLGIGIAQLGVSLAFTFMFFVDGRRIGAAAQDVLRRVAGDQTPRLLPLIGRTVKGTVYGVIGTGLAQALVATVGFYIAQVPAALLLGFLTFFLSFLPMGAPLVWVPTTLWLLSDGRWGWAIFMAVWGMVGISGIDNLVRPYLISREARLSFALVFIGALGGILAFGFIGVFLGPTLLAVAYALLQVWLGERVILTPAPMPPCRGAAPDSPAKATCVEGTGGRAPDAGCGR